MACPIECSELLEKLTEDTIKFDYDNARTYKHVTYIPIKFNLDGKFKTYSKIAIRNEKVFGTVKPYTGDGETGRYSQDKIPIKISDGTFLDFMEKVEVFFKKSAGDKKVYDMVKSFEDGQIKYACLNIKYNKQGRSLCERIYDKNETKVVDGKKVTKDVTVDNKLPTRENIHSIFPTGTIISGYFYLPGIALTEDAASCSAVLKDVVIQRPTDNLAELA